MEKRKEVPIIEIGKVKVRHDRIVVEYKEKHRDENYVDTVRSFFIINYSPRAENA